ncbi:MAG TPA: glycosyltransferase [Nitrospiria bacterium]|nr:glycosyltransferase [Nitrospiria bacterium]
MTAHRIPLALFTYNRPVHACKLLDSLSRCRRLDEVNVIIHCDGPKTDPDRAAVDEVRALVHTRAAGLKARVVERPRNLGLASSIVTGVTDLCDQYGSVIVLEDDMQVAPDFLDYMIQALDRYESEPDVYQVSAFMYPVVLPGDCDAYFLRLTTTWGWATWKRAWRVFDWRATGAHELLADPAMRRRFDLDGAYPYAHMLEDRLGGKNDSWGILWWWAVFQTGGLVLHPRTSLVWVGGFDGTGTHCGPSELNQAALDSMSQPRLGGAIRFPARVEVSEGVLERIKEHLATERAASPHAAPRQWASRLLRPLQRFGRRDRTAG